MLWNYFAVGNREIEIAKLYFTNFDFAEKKFKDCKMND